MTVDSSSTSPQKSIPNASKKTYSPKIASSPASSENWRVLDLVQDQKGSKDQRNINRLIQQPGHLMIGIPSDHSMINVQNHHNRQVVQRQKDKQPPEHPSGQYPDNPHPKQKGDQQRHFQRKNIQHHKVQMLRPPACFPLIHIAIPRLFYSAKSLFPTDYDGFCPSVHNPTLRPSSNKLNLVS